jgi:hypothetical protein
VSQNQTLKQSECNHITKVIKWSYNLIDGDMVPYVSIFGCTNCNETSDVPFESDEFAQVDHDNCDKSTCFGCKAKSLQLSAGDASGNKLMTKKKHDSELEAYRRARKQGIQPAGTTMAKIEEAHKASEVLGEAYKAGAMPPAKHITKTSAEVMKELKK